MEDNADIFWDKRINTEEAKRVLKDKDNPRFIEFASLLLARSNKPRRIFADYLNKELFVEKWINIKRRMRDNKWNDRRIIFWDEIYKAVRKNIAIKGLRKPRVRPLDIDPEIKIICDKIKDYRKKSGLTQIELAEKTGLSQQSISFVEQGYINISLRTLKKIADALNLRILLENKLINCSIAEDSGDALVNPKRRSRMAVDKIGEQTPQQNKRSEGKGGLSGKAGRGY